MNNMAFKSVEINKELLFSEINYIRNHKWTILENVRDSYDFGLLYVDYTPYKTVIVEHCIELEEKLA